MTTQKKTISNPVFKSMLMKRLNSDEAIARATRDAVAHQLGVYAEQQLTFKEYLEQVRALAKLANAGLVQQDVANRVLKNLVVRMVDSELRDATWDLFDFPDQPVEVKHTRTNHWIRFSRLGV